MHALVLLFQKAILMLPTMQRTVFNLRYYDELPYEEIASVTGSSVGAAKTNYHYAKEKSVTIYSHTNETRYLYTSRQTNPLPHA